MTEHADFEALSAYVDGEAPEWADHVAGCAACRATVDELRSVAAAVGVPAEAPEPRFRDAAVRAALDAAGGRPAGERVRPVRRLGFTWPVNLAAVAALLVVVVGLSAFLVMDRSAPVDRTTMAESAPKSADSAAGLPPTDLGDVPDAATLLARARPALTATTSATTATGAARSAASANSGAAAAAPAPGAVAGDTGLASGGAGGPALVAPSVTGTRPCEEQARARQPGLGQVVYFATARRGQTPAIVLGFATGPAPAPVTLLLLAQDGCSELLRAVGP